MCDEFSSRLFRPWSNLDSRNHSKQIEVPVGRDINADIGRPCDDSYNIFMIRDKTIEASPSQVGVSSFDLPNRSLMINDKRSTEDSGLSGGKLTSKVIHSMNDNSLRTTNHTKMPLVQDIVDPVFHSIYSCNSFRKFNSPHSTSFEAVMTGACLPSQMGITYPPWVDIRKMQIFNTLQPSYDIRGHLHAETMDRAVQILQRHAKEPKKLRSKRFRCEHCNVAFSNNGQLKGHIRIHTGERPFKCDVENCGKAFTRNEELTRHKRIHTGLRPHACLVCGKSFGRKDHLKKHMRTHENRDYRLSAATLGMFTPGHILSSQGLLFPHYNFPT